MEERVNDDFDLCDEDEEIDCSSNGMNPQFFTNAVQHNETNMMDESLSMLCRVAFSLNLQKLFYINFYICFKPKTYLILYRLFR